MAFIMAFFTILGLLWSCGGKDDKKEPKTTEIELVRDGVSEYIINYYMDYRDIAIELQDKIFELTGVKLETTFDAASHTDKEIVIGPNNSDEYYNDPILDTLYKNDYLIGAYTQRIIIEGGGPTAIYRAADDFSQMLSDAVADSNIILTLNDRTYHPDGTPFSLAADGGSDYTIICSKGASTPAILAVSYFKDEFKALTGIDIMVSNDEAASQIRLRTYV